MENAIKIITGIFYHEDIPRNYQNILTVTRQEFKGITENLVRDIADGVASNLEGGRYSQYIQFEVL